MIDDIEGIMVMVSNQQKALEFYTQKLGFEKKVDHGAPEYRWIVVCPKNSNTVISLVDPTLMKDWPLEIIEERKARIGTTTGIWFYTKDIHTTYQELKSKQVEITPPEKQVWGGVMSSIFDQDKNILGLVGDSKD
ncbi:VOC family protein [Nitrosopumilus sp.]|uniref:VOC family protein n=1 Tax=Nitrosopumilus sp. TaxID=2024843 RepID=UPI002931D4E1|nr:VOC family protein [Nitrosopumilus sp.]